MESKNLTAQTFGTMIGKSKATIYNYLDGKSIPQTDVAEAILKAFPDVSADWLITGKGEVYKDGNKASPAALIAEEPQPIYARAGADLLAMQQRLAQLEEHIRVLKLYLADKDKLIAMLESEVSRLKTLS